MRRLLLACLLAFGAMSSAQDEAAQNDAAPTEEGSAAAQDGADEGASDVTTIEDILRGRGDVSVFLELLESTGMIDEITEPGAYTLFVPTDEAFEALDQQAFAETQSNIGEIEGVLRNHIVMGNSNADALARMQTFTNIAGYQQYVTGQPGSLVVGEARVLVEDLVAANGVVHVIDSVLIPVHQFPRKNQSTIPAGGTANDED